MRKVYATISIVVVSLVLYGCRQARFNPTVAPPASPSSTRVIPKATPSRSSTRALLKVTPSRSSAVAPTPSNTAGAYSCGTAAPTPTPPPPLWFTAEAKPTQQPLAAATRESQSTLAPVPTLHLTSAIPVTLSCDSHRDTAWRSWTAVDLMPFHALLADRGLLWVSTSLGVFQVDPRTAAFTRTLSSDTAAGMHQMFPLGEGRLWGNTSNGPLYYDGQVWSTMPIAGMPTPQDRGHYPYVRGIDRNGDLWTVSQVGQQVTYYRFPGHFPPPNGAPWIATPVPDVPHDDICEWPSDPARYRSLAECQTLYRTNGSLGANPSGLGWTDNLLMGADGKTWRLGHYTSATIDKTVWVLAGIDRNQIITQELPITFAGPMAADPQQGIWLGTDRGLLYSDGKDLRLGLIKDLDACVSPSYVKEIAVASAGTIWARSLFDGMYALPPGTVEWQRITDATPAGPQPTKQIILIAAATQGGIWATHGDDLFRFGGPDAMSPIQLPENCRLGESDASKLIVKAGSLWATGAECGLLQFDVAKATWILHRTLWSPNGWVRLGEFGIDADADGTVYALSRMGLYTHTTQSSMSDIHPSEWRRVPLQVNANRIVVDHTNGVWLASTYEGRVWYYNHSRVTTLDVSLEKDRLRGLSVDSQNRLWIILDRALMVYDGHRFRRMTMPLRYIDAWTIGSDDRMWLNLDGSVVVYDPTKDKQP